MTRKQMKQIRKYRLIRSGAVIVVTAATVAAAAIVGRGEAKEAQIPEKRIEVESYYGWRQEAPIEAETMVLREIINPTVETMAYTVVSEPMLEAFKEIPMNDELQFKLMGYCEEFEVPLALALAVIEQESTFRANAVNCYGNCFGYMQINQINGDWLNETIGVTDIKDPEQNLKSGVYMLHDLLQKYGDTEKALICYNCGEGGAKRNYFDQGVYSNKYSQEVVQKMAKWEGVIYG